MKVSGKTEETKIDILETENNMLENPKECRICLDNSIAQSPLIQPCKCDGTLTYVHQTCMKQWIQKKKHKNQTQIQCQICKSDIKFQAKEGKSCSTCSQFKENVRNGPKLFIFLLVADFFNLSFICVLSWLISSLDFNHYSQSASIKLAILLSGLGALLVIIFISIYLIIKQYAIEEKTQILTIYEQKKGRKLIIPEENHSNSKQSSIISNKMKIVPEIMQFQ